MLVLSRKLYQTIRIGDDISVTVTQVGRARVRLSIEAPAHVDIRRGEITAHSELRESEQSTPNDLPLIGRSRPLGADEDVG